MLITRIPAAPAVDVNYPVGFARAQGVPAVLTNAVRHATRDQAPVVDVLDAIRRLVPLDSRPVVLAALRRHEGSRRGRLLSRVATLLVSVGLVSLVAGVLLWRPNGLLGKKEA